MAIKTEQYLKWRMEMNTPGVKRGELSPMYTAKYGGIPKNFYDCDDCGITFIAEDRVDYKGMGKYEGKAQCNGHSIDLCPYCRTDSTPWRYGRGI